MNWLRNKWKCIVGGILVLPVIVFGLGLVGGCIFLIIKKISTEQFKIEWMVLLRGIGIIVGIVLFACITSYGITLLEECIKENKRKK